MLYVICVQEVYYRLHYSAIQGNMPEFSQAAEPPFWVAVHNHNDV